MTNEEPRLPHKGEHLVIHGLVYQMRKHTMKSGNRPKDIVLRLLGIYMPEPAAQPAAPLPDATPPIQIVASKDEPCEMVDEDVH